MGTDQLCGAYAVPEVAEEEILDTWLATELGLRIHRQSLYHGSEFVDSR